LRALNKGTELDNPLELSLHERMNLSVKGYKNALIGVGVVAVLLLIASVYRTVFFYANTDLVVSPEVADVFNAINGIGLFVLIVSAGMVVWVLKAGRKIYQQNNDINRDYTHQAYLLALSVSARTKDDVDLNFYNVARDVFPELKQLDIESIEKSGEEITVEELTIGSKKDEYVLDIVTKTREGKFVIKHFKEKAVYADLERCLNIVKNEGWGDMLRLVCLAEDFDSDILKNYEKLSKGIQSPVDLILYNEKGFSALKISDEI